MKDEKMQPSGKKEKKETVKSPFLEFTPEKIIFSQLTPNGTYITTLSIRNTSEDHIAIKVKTNSPSSYIVKPNLSIIPPGGTTDLKINSQPGIALVF